MEERLKSNFNALHVFHLETQSESGSWTRGWRVPGPTCLNPDAPTKAYRDELRLKVQKTGTGTTPEHIVTQPSTDLRKLWCAIAQSNGDGTQ